jgi:hypothetical protein
MSLYIPARWKDAKIKGALTDMANKHYIQVSFSISRICFH